MSRPDVLSVAITDLVQHRALLDGSVSIPGVDLDFVPVAEHSEIFRRMGLEEFDVCEWSAVSYLLARQEGMGVTALPIVARHAFRHGDFLVNRSAGIRTPADLVGRRVGTRSYTVTPGVLDRGLLTDEFGIDTGEITWVLAEPVHVPGFQDRLPANVEPPDGRGNLFPRLISGDLGAGIAGVNLRRERSPEVVALFEDAAQLDRAEYQRTGILPVFTVIAVHERALQGRPWLLEALYTAFASSLAAGYELGPGVAEIVGAGPPPFGLSANRGAFEQLLRYGEQQKILTGALGIDDFFHDFG